jgi:hypothetical protein
MLIKRDFITDKDQAPQVKKVETGNNMKMLVFMGLLMILALLFSNCGGNPFIFLALPSGQPDLREPKGYEGFHRTDLLLAQSLIPKRVGFILSDEKFNNEYLNNIEATKKLKSGLTNLGFNLVEKQKIDEVLGYISSSAFELPLKITEEKKRRMNKELGLEVILIARSNIHKPFMKKLFQEDEYFVRVELIQIQEETVMWLGIIYDSCLVKATERIVKLLEKDIKAFNEGKKI